MGENRVKTCASTCTLDVTGGATSQGKGHLNEWYWDRWLSTLKNIEFDSYRVMWETKAKGKYLKTYSPLTIP